MIVPKVRGLNLCRKKLFIIVILLTLALPADVRARAIGEFVGISEMTVI
jgi:hypothetical protein